MSNHIFIPPIALSNSVPLPSPLPIPKFQIGQDVFWANVPSQDSGKIIGILWASESSVVATGFHYAVMLDYSHASQSSVLIDWAFEQDLEVLPPDN